MGSDEWAPPKDREDLRLFDFAMGMMFGATLATTLVSLGFALHWWLR